MNEIILHHYEFSTFSQKVRTALGLKGLAWRSVDIPGMPPRTLLSPLTGGYRRAPVPQVGAAISRETHPTLAPPARAEGRVNGGAQHGGRLGWPTPPFPLRWTSSGPVLRGGSPRRQSVALSAALSASTPAASARPGSFAFAVSSLLDGAKMRMGTSLGIRRCGSATTSRSKLGTNTGASSPRSTSVLTALSRSPSRKTPAPPPSPPGR